jgi:cytochrome P450
MMLALPVGPDGWTGTVDLQPLNFRLTVDSASEFLFGESCNSQLAALPDYPTPTHSNEVSDAAFVQAFEHSQDKIAQAFRLNDWYYLLLTKDYYESCKVCHKYIDHFVQRALDHEKKGPASGDKEKYFFLEGLAAQTQDPVEIRDQLLSILVAGRDTTASLLGFLWLMLCQHPEVFSKLRAAVINDFGTYNHSKEISFSGLKKCSYLQWCMNEVLRLFPSVPMNSRRSVRDTTIPRGGGPDGMSPVFVPKSTEVMYSVYVMHRNKDIWGPDAEAFIPERWEKRKAGFEYLPFNGGPR